MTDLKAGYDVDTVEDVMVESFYDLTYDMVDDETPEPLFNTNRILQGNAGKISLQSGNIAFFDIGDTVDIEEGLGFRSPTWAVHDAYLWVVVPGESRTAKTRRNEIIRLIQLYVDNNPNFGVNGLNVTFPKVNSVTRLRVTFDNKDVEPEKKKWNMSCMIKFEVKIARIPVTVEDEPVP